MPLSEREEWVTVVGVVLVSKLEAPQPNFWLAGLGRNRTSGGRHRRFRHADRKSSAYYLFNESGQTYLAFLVESP
jgi:hypothetical protein